MNSGRFKIKLSGAAAGAAALSALGACAIGPDFRRPPDPAVAGYTAEPLPAATAAAAVAGGEAQALVVGADIPAQWWRLFESAPLDAIVERALKKNPNVGAAQAALRAAIENYKSGKGIYYPSAQANYSPSRQRNAVGTLAPQLTSGAPVFSLYTAQVAISYVLDPIGGTRRQVESAAALADSQRFELEATYLTLSANVVVAAVQEASLRAQLSATEQIAQSGRQTLDIMRSRYALGAIALADVVAQQAALAQIEASLTALRKQLAQQRDLLTALSGEYSSNEPPETFELSGMKLPTSLPVSLPAQLVRQRPDVRAAEEQLHAASAQVGIAIANLLPQITLSATAGSSATAQSDLFRSGNNYWSVAGGLTQPLFAGGALLHRKRAADAGLAQAAAQYQATVIAAFQNVADTLRALEFDAQALDQDVHAERAAAEGLEITRHQLDLGAVSSLALLNAQQTYQQAALNLAQAKANRLMDTAALFQALGGGWWNRAETLPRR